MKRYIKHRVVLSEAQSTSVLQYFNQTLRLAGSKLTPHTLEEGAKYVLLHLVGKESPAIGDWVINEVGETFKKQHEVSLEKTLKLVATSDPELEGLPKLSLDFLEEYASVFNQLEEIGTVYVEYVDAGITCGARRAGEDCGGCQGFCDWEHIYRVKIDETDCICARVPKQSYTIEDVENILDKIAWFLDAEDYAQLLEQTILCETNKIVR